MRNVRNVRKCNYSTKHLTPAFVMCVLAALIALAFMPLSAQAGTKIGKSGKTVKKPAKVRLTSVKVTSVNQSKKRAKITVKFKKAKAAKKYQIYLKVNKGKYKKVKTTAKQKYVYNAAIKKAYSIKVRAVNKNKKGKFSAVKTVKIPGQVTKVKMSVNKQKIKVTWRKAKYANRYKVYTKVNKGKYKLKKTVKSNRYTFTGGKGKKYFVKVKAFNGKTPTVFSGQTAKTTQKYSYSVKLVGKKAYNDMSENAFYVKTNNPNINTFDICIDDAKGKENISFFCPCTNLEYDDVVYKKKYEDDGWKYGWAKVNGGYLITLELKSPGKCKISIIEHLNNYASIYGTDEESFWLGYDKVNTCQISTGTITVHDYNKEESAWMNKIIKKLTTKKMTGEQKMTAIANYLVSAHNNF